jgi:hypothetical protein
MKHTFKMISGVLLAIAATLTANMVYASTQTHAELMAPFSACKKIKQDSQRLACFDVAVDQLQPNAKKMPEQNTSAHVANNGLFGLEHKKYSENAASEIEVTVVKVKKNPYGYLKFTLDNGQVWIQTTTRRLKLKTGERIRIERSLLGSFKVYKLESNAGYKVKRLK